MMEFVFLIAMVIVLAYLSPSAGGSAYNATECMAPSEDKVVKLSCRGGEQLQILSYAAGRLLQWESSRCDVTSPTRFDCFYHDVELTENTRGRCNTYNKCPLQVTYETPDVCKAGFAGPRFINIHYQCVPGTGSADVGIPTFLNPMAMGTHRLNGSRVVLQSDEYPALIQTANQAHCQVDLPSSKVKVLINIYDLSYLGSFTTPPYCVSGRGLSGDVCAEKGGYFEDQSYSKSTELSFRLQTTSEVYVRFWIVLTAVSVDDSTSLRSLEVTCRDAATAADASSLTGSVDGDYALGISLTVIAVILIIICAVYCCKKRRKKRKAEQNHAKYKYHPNRGRGIEDNDYLES